GALAAALAMSSAISAPFARGRSWPALSLAHHDLRHLDDAGWRWPLTRWEALRTGCIHAGAVLSFATALPLAACVAASAVGPSILVRSRPGDARDRARLATSRLLRGTEAASRSCASFAVALRRATEGTTDRPARGPV